MKILVAEDDQMLAKAYRLRLEQEGYELIFAETGLEALRLAEEEKPDIVLLDIIMPQKDGFFFLEQLCEKEGVCRMPVIVLSNVDQEQFKKKGLKLGAVEYLVKAKVDIDEIVAKIKGYAV